MTIRPAQESDATAMERLRQALWPSAEGEHRAEIAAYFAGRVTRPAQVLMAFEEEGRAVGFIELAIRNYAEGCTTDRVAYLDGWYVEPGWRRRGVGRALVMAAEVWAREQGLTELASDTAIDNETAAAAHRALDFKETVRAICFVKRL